MKILYAPFSSTEDFLARLDVGEDAGAGRVRVQTKARYTRGEIVVLEIGFPGLPNRVLLRTVAHASEPTADGELEFDVATGEEHKRDFLVAVAAGRAHASWQRKNRRFPVRLPARFVVEREGSPRPDETPSPVPLRGDAQTEDVSAGGVLLRTTRSLPEGARVSIVLDPCDGSAEMEFSGRVVYTRKGDGENGIGVQFDKLNNDEMKRLRRMIRDVKLRGKMVEWEDAAIGGR